MKKSKSLTLEQKRVDVDIWIILIATFGTFLLYTAFREPLMVYIADSKEPVPLRLFLNAAFQFGIAGLGIAIVCVLRREKLSRFGLVKKNAVKSIIGAVGCFIPYFIYIFGSGRYTGYQPFQILITQDVVRSRFPINVLGLLLIVLVWGFFEGINYAVISDKLNIRYPCKNKWLDIGAITCASVCILFHSLDFSLFGIIEMLTTYVAIYGMLMVKKQTYNAWGCVFVFCFIWNAI